MREGNEFDYPGVISKSSRPSIVGSGVGTSADDWQPTKQAGCWRMPRAARRS